MGQKTGGGKRESVRPNDPIPLYSDFKGVTT